MRRKRPEGNIGRRDASKLKIGIAVALFNSDITEALLAAARNELRAWNVRETSVHIVHVNGSFELPFACMQLMKKHKVDAVIALGCIVRGETKHDEYLAHSVFNALQEISRRGERPIGLGVLTVDSLAQAKKRIEYGSAAAAAALDAALL